MEPEANAQVEEDTQATLPADTLQLELHNLSLPHTDFPDTFPETFRQTFPIPDTMVDADDTAPALTSALKDGGEEDPKRRRAVKASNMEDEVMSGAESSEPEAMTPKTAKRERARVREAKKDGEIGWSIRCRSGGSSFIATLIGCGNNSQGSRCQREVGHISSGGA